MLNFLRCLLIFALVTSFTWLLSAPPARADGCASLVSLGAPYNQNFDTLATGGTTNATSTLPVGWTLTETDGGVRDNEQYGADDGSSNIGDTYSYGATGNNERAFGGLRSGTLDPVIGVCFTNNTGVTINSLKIVYVGEMWRLGTAGRTDQLDFEYSTTATSLTTGTWTAANPLDFITPNTSGAAGTRDGNSPANRAVSNATITGLSIANGANFWLRWIDLNASGSDDGLALDNFSLIPLAATANLTATKTDVLATDADSDTQADPGDVLSYTVVISSSGAAATGLILSDTLDANTDLLGSASVSPLAFDNAYNASANPASLNVPDGPTDLFADDYPGQNPAASGISSFGGGSLPGDAGTNTAGSTVTFGVGGSLTVNANGSFDFTPPAGFQGSFGFFYRLQNSLGPSDGLVTIAVDAPPTVSSTNPTNGATNVNGASNLTINFSENVNIAAGGITIDCGAGAVSFTPALPQNGINALTLDPTANLPGNATCTVTVAAANTTDSDANDPPNQLDGNGDGTEGDNYVFSFQVAPTANDDSFAVTPHLTLNSSGTTTVTVRANDDPTTVTITGFGDTLLNANVNAPGSTITTTLSGRLTLNGDGTFTYNPPPDQRSTNDAFFYTITGGDTATVTLTIQNQALIWFVDASAAAGGNGTQARPFNLLTGVGSFDAVASDNTGDFIFIADGSYTCGLTLLNNQTVIGDGASSTLQAISGVTPVSGSSLPAFSGADPTLSNAAGDCLTLEAGNTLRGLTIGNTSATGSDITGANFGTLTVTETTLNGTGRALNLNNGTFNATLDGLTSTSGTNNVNLVSVNGTANLGSGALSGASSDAFVINGGNVSATYNGNVSQASNAALVSVSGGHSSGTLTFQTGTLNATSGTGLQFDNADGVYNFNGPTTLNGGDAGVDILNGSSGTFNFGTGATITNPSGTAFNINGSNAAGTYSGSISDNTGFVIDINNHDGGTYTFDTGSIISTASGIRVANSNGGTINFNSPTKNLNTGASQAVTLDTNNGGGTVNFGNGGLNIDTTSATGFSATGGGTVNVTSGVNPNTIDSTTGTALNVANTIIGVSGLTFRSITSNDTATANGIVLDSTGSSGGLTVTGTGTAGSGGTIANKQGADNSTTSGIGIYLNSTSNVSLNWMQLNDFQNSAITGRSVNGFTLTNSVINGVIGTNSAPVEGPINFGVTNPSGTNGLQGTGLIRNTRISGGIEHNLEFYNQSGSMSLTIDGTSVVSEGANPNSPADDVADCIIEENSVPLGSDGILIEMQGTAVATIVIDRCLFRDNKSQPVQIAANDNSSITATIDESWTRRFDQGNEGFILSNGSNGDLTAMISNNRINNYGGVGIFVGQTPGNATASSLLNASILNNIVNQPTTATNHGIIAFLTSTVGQFSQARVRIDGNTVINNSTSGVARGILVDTPDTNTSPAFHATVTNNTVAVGDNVNGVAGLVVQSRQSSDACANIGSNTVTFPNGTPMGVFGIRARQVTPATYDLEGSASCPGAPASVLSCRNPGSTTEVLGTLTVVAAGTCLLPSVP
ncbi:MAG: hypothetical protein DPW09_10680 [Anaerolineae bacterium]|nr:hypothetical protein [Anaerolineae bacterium]